MSEVSFSGSVSLREASKLDGAKDGVGAVFLPHHFDQTPYFWSEVTLVVSHLTVEVWNQLDPGQVPALRHLHVRWVFPESMDIPVGCVSDFLPLYPESPVRKRSWSSLPIQLPAGSSWALGLQWDDVVETAWRDCLWVRVGLHGRLDRKSGKVHTLM